MLSFLLSPQLGVAKVPYHPVTIGNDTVGAGEVLLGKNKLETSLSVSGN